MFGWTGCFDKGALVAGLHKPSMISRLSENDRVASVKIEGAGKFEPMPGPKMKGYVVLESPLTRERKELAYWMKRSLEYGSSLPPKSNKAAKQATKRISKK